MTKRKTIMQMTMRKRGKESVSSVRKIGGRRRRREREKEKEVEVAVVERKRENSLARALALFFVPSLAIIIPRQCGMTFPRGVEVKTEECLEKRNLSREYFPLSHSLSRALGVLRSNFLEGKKKRFGHHHRRRSSQKSFVRRETNATTLASAPLSVPCSSSLAHTGGVPVLS